MRKTNPALRDGAEVMINVDSDSVLSYVRQSVAGSAPVVVALNTTAQPQTITLTPATAGVTGTKVKTLLSSEPSLMATKGLTVTLPPYASWVASVQ